MTVSFLLDLLLRVWLPIALLVAAGGLWLRFHPGFVADALRVQLNRLVVDVFAPPLLFALAAQATITSRLLSVPLITAGGIAVGGSLLYLALFRSPLGRGLSRETRTAILIAGAWSNVLFMGYPTLTFLYGERGGSYAAFADMLASTPLLWTLGVWIATRLGHGDGRGHSLLGTFIRLPPVWGFVLGFLVHLSGLDAGEAIKAARFMGQAAVPIMLFALGLTIPWNRLQPSRPVLFAVLCKLVLAPLAMCLVVRQGFGATGDPQTAAILEVTMPGMLMASTFADRFGLDARAAALTTGWSSLIFMLSLPIWIVVLRP